MEEHKHRARDHFLKRSGKSLESFLKSLTTVKHELNYSHDALKPEWKEGREDKFLKLMIMDVCFMLEVMTAAVIKKEKEKEKENDYEPDDPIFGSHRYITPYIRRDMLMLENQLPMLVLYELVAEANNGNKRDEEINELILRFYSLDTGIKGMGRFLHVLDLFRKGLLTDSKSGEDDKSCLETCIAGMGQVVDVFTKCLLKKAEKDKHKIIRSATELDEAGIRFKTSKTNSLKDVSFAGGKLKLPVIVVDDAFKSNFLNVMTFERLHIGAGTGVTSYVVFMDNIINDKQDVALLHTEGIIQNSIGSNEAVAELFNSLCKEVTLASSNSLESVQNDISKHCLKHRNRWRAYFNRTYFKNPWTILSLIAAIFLFALTIIQTVYALLDYY